MGAQNNVYVVLSKSPTFLSQAIHVIKGDSYTHASLSLDKNLTYMFSFGRRRPWNPFIGCFKRESMSDALYGNFNTLPGVVLEISVTETQYIAICGMTESFLLNAHEYGYNYFGLAGNLLGIPRGNRKRFFCSEFVYHVLHECGVCDFGVPREMVRPQNLLKLEGRTVFDGDLKLYGTRPFIPDLSYIFRFPHCFSKV